MSDLENDCSNANLERCVEVCSIELNLVDPLRISHWLAMSLLQKSIRRGRCEFAFRAAAMLLATSSERLWRRIGIAVFEDIGAAETHVAALVTTALQGKTVCAKLGGEAAVAGQLLRKMAQAPKCRAADDLAIACEWDPALDRLRNSLPQKSTEALLELAFSSAPIQERGLALWYAIGTDHCRSALLLARPGIGTRVFEEMRLAGFDAQTIETAASGFRRTRSIMCPFLVLLNSAADKSARQVEADTLPIEELIGEVPCWALDMHVREGNRAVALLLKGESESARWVRYHIPEKDRVAFLAGILFRIESGLVDRRLAWPEGLALKLRVDEWCHGFPDINGRQILHLLRQDLPELNEARRHVLRANSR